MPYINRIKTRVKDNKLLLIIATIAVVLLVLFAIIAFTHNNRENITSQNRKYLLESTHQMAMHLDAALAQGLTNIRMLSNLLSEMLVSPKIDISSLQYILNNSIFDFIELTDPNGMNHTITGHISDARDRNYYMESRKGASGIELLFNSRATKETLLVFYSPIYFHGEFTASLVGAYQATNRLGKLLTMDVFDHIAESYLCNENGIIIASNMPLDTPKMISIEEVLGARISGTSSNLLYKGKTEIVPLNGNETGACIMGLKFNDWYVVQVFPQEANETMIANANRNGIILAAFLVVLLAILLALTYTLLSRANQATRKALVKAEAASAAKTEFLFNMSHDIRTPMNAIIGFLRLLDKQQDNPEKRKKYLGKIDYASSVLLSILNNVLEISKIESGDSSLHKTVVDIGHLHNSMYEMFAPQMREKSITFTKDADIRHRMVLGDLTKLQKIYLNILSNAWKYTRNDGQVAMRLVEFPTAKAGSAEFKIEIEDNGIGISREFMPHIFNKFSREQNSTHSKIAGIGLGMSIVKILLAQMNGSIDVASEPGKGTKVSVSLRFPTVAQDEKDGNTTNALSADFMGKRILLAEDNEFNAEIAIDILNEIGFEVEVAKDGKICLDMLERAPDGYYDLVLMDIQMPNMNGYEASEAIRKLDNLTRASIPIVALTANAFEEDSQNAFAAGMDAHLAKPFDIPALIGTLNNILASRKSIL